MAQHAALHAISFPISDGALHLSSASATATACLFFLLLAALSSFILLSYRKPAKWSNRPPSPPKLPVIGNLHQLGSLAHRSLGSLAAKHGAVMLLHFGTVPTVIVSSAEAAEEMMRAQDVAFASRPSSSVFDRMLYGSRDLVLAKYGDYWRQLRRICVTHLLSLRQVQSFGSTRAEEVAILIDRLRAAAGRPVNLSKMIVALSCDILCRVAFGSKQAEEVGGGDRIQDLLSASSQVFGSFPVRDFVPGLGWIDRLSGFDAKVTKAATNLDNFIERLIVEHESNSAGGRETCTNLLDILLSLGGDGGGSDGALGRDSIKAIIFDMFVAGTDTTDVTINWVMAELIKHPKERKRAQEEIRRVVGSQQGIREEMIERMRYVKAVIKETLRLHPPLPLLLPRESIEDTKLLEYHIPKGTRVMVNAWAIGRDPASWEKAEEFWPERFLNATGSSTVDFSGQDFRLIPFGAGRRGCPGIDFAICTVELVVANLLYHFEWELPDGMKEEELNMTEAPGVTAARKWDLILVGKPLSA